MSVSENVSCYTSDIITNQESLKESKGQIVEGTAEIQDTPPSVPYAVSQVPSPSDIMNNIIQAKESRYGDVNINSLPDEMILHIFGFLTQNQLGKVAEVCSKWKILSRDGSLWRHVNVEFHQCGYNWTQTYVASLLVNQLPSNCTSIRFCFKENWSTSLNFNNLSNHLKDSYIQMRIIILHSARLTVTLPGMINLCSSNLPTVRVLIVRSCNFLWPPERDEYYSSKIEVLDISFCSCKRTFSRMSIFPPTRMMDDSWFIDSTSFLDELKVLNLGGTSIGSLTFQTIKNHSKHLTELYLCKTEIKDNDLNNCVFPHLQVVCLNSCRGVTYVGIVSLVHSCRSLLKVYVSIGVAKSYSAHPSIVKDALKLEIVRAIHCNAHHKLLNY